jgi:hypothetical protein
LTQKKIAVSVTSEGVKRIRLGLPLDLKTFSLPKMTGGFIGISRLVECMSKRSTSCHAIESVAGAVGEANGLLGGGDGFSQLPQVDADFAEVAVAGGCIPPPFLSDAGICTRLQKVRRLKKTTEAAEGKGGG